MPHTDVDIGAYAQAKLESYRLEAECARQRTGRGWRLQAAQALRGLAERLEAGPAPEPSLP